MWVAIHQEIYQRVSEDKRQKKSIGVRKENTKEMCAYEKKTIPVLLKLNKCVIQFFLNLIHHILRKRFLSLTFTKSCYCIVLCNDNI